jgi:hypothetical protein
VRIREYQIQVGPVISAELLAEFILTSMMHVEGGKGGFRTFTSRGLSVLVPLNSSTCLVCVNDSAALMDI